MSYSSGQDLVIIASPFNIGIGGFKRSFKVLPYLLDKISKDDSLSINKVVLYIPATSLRAVLKIFLQKYKDIDLSIEKTYKLLDQTLNTIKNSCRIIDLNKEFLEEALTYNISLLRNEFSKGSSISTYLLKLRTFNVLAISKFEEKFINKFININYKRISPKFIYSMHETVESIKPLNLFLNKWNCYCAIMLQLAPFVFKIPYSNTRSLDLLLEQSYIRKLYLSIFNSNKLRMLLSVSAAPLVESPVSSLAYRYKSKVVVIKPSNAIDTTVNSFRRSKKRSLNTVFFGRLSPEKGIFDLLKIWKVVINKVPKAKLYVIGSFPDEKVRLKFINLIKHLNIHKNVILIGYIDREEDLYKIVSASRILLYPSYSDAFPLTVLEAIALGLVVIAYKIPALYFMFKDLPQVFLIRPGDIYKMAYTVIKILHINDETFNNLTNNELTEKFIKLHSSWYKVAETEYLALKNVIK